MDSSRIQGQGVQSLAAAGSAGDKVTIESKNRDQTRKQFVVSNLEAAGSGNVFYIMGTDGSEALPVFPQTSVTLETDSPFRLKNPNVGAVSYVVGELFFRGVTIGGTMAARSNAGSGGSGGGNIYSGDQPRPGNKFLP
jgi:hypothetical protein